MPHVTHFEIHAQDPERIAQFYRSAFGWTCTFHSNIDYWTIDTGRGAESGIDGGIFRRKGPQPSTGQAVNAFVCTVTVPDLDAYLAKALAHGADLAVAKFAIPFVGHAAYVRDPDGNILGLMQSDASVR